MESKTIALVVIIIVSILLFISIRYKIKTDKMTKSLLVNSPIPKEKKSFLVTTPSAVLAIITVVGATIVSVFIRSSFY